MRRILQYLKARVTVCCIPSIGEVYVKWFCAFSRFVSLKYVNITSISRVATPSYTFLIFLARWTNGWRVTDSLQRFISRLSHQSVESNPLNTTLIHHWIHPKSGFNQFILSNTFKSSRIHLHPCMALWFPIMEHTFLASHGPLLPWEVPKSSWSSEEFSNTWTTHQRLSVWLSMINV